MKIYEIIPVEYKNILDGISVTATVISVVAILPAIATLLSIVWISIRIWETDTVQKHFGHSRDDVDSLVAQVVGKTILAEDAKHQ